MMRPSSCSTLIIEICRIYLTLGWMNICFGPLLNIGTLHVAVLLLGRWIWCLQWRNIQLYYLAQGFKLIKHILEPRMSHIFGRN
ncbi:hypothetical protein Golob_024685 [Gossypium lobatum]|uniref:Uncharacterized protein n=1 Tax=Gossypium lobatum TaxID=34289 RepID=A0A7J8NHE4_9ROSI|nr:hypothetical protein [Gossypium lobatum]